MNTIRRIANSVRLLAGALLLTAIRPAATAGPLIERPQGEAHPAITGTGGSGKYFGFEMAVDGDRLWVCALLDQDEPYTPGAVHVFQRTGAEWVREARLIAEGTRLLGFSLAADGEVAVTGARDSSVEAPGTNLNSEFSFEQGRVRFYELVEPYPDWADTQGLIPGLTDGLLDDPDGDGSRNLYEYATGSDATNAASISPLLIETSAVVRFTRYPDALDATLVLERSTHLTDGSAWTGIASNIWGQWISDLPIVESNGVVRTVNVPLVGSAPPHAAYRLNVRSPTP